MKTVCVHKAEPFPDEPIPDLQIHIASVVPEWKTLLEKADAFFTDEAIKLEVALYESLPGGTYDRLTGLMLKRKASHFCVSHDGPKLEKGAK